MDYRSKANKEFDKLYLKFVLLLGLLGSYLKYLTEERGEALNNNGTRLYSSVHTIFCPGVVSVFSALLF